MVALPKAEAHCIEPTLPLPRQRAELIAAQEAGILLVDSSTKPRLKGRPHRDDALVEWSTDAFELAEAKVYICYQAAMVAAMAMLLEPAGVVVVEVEHKSKKLKAVPSELAAASFKDIEVMLQLATGPAQAFTPSAPIGKMDSTLDIFRRTFGSFVIHCFHFHEEDIEAADIDLHDGVEYYKPNYYNGKDTVGDAIPHYINYNATTRLLQLYPEVSTCPQHTLHASPLTRASHSCVADDDPDGRGGPQS